LPPFAAAPEPRWGAIWRLADRRQLKLRVDDN
jgi:hypothetical protein